MPIHIRGSYTRLGPVVPAAHAHVLRRRQISRRSPAAAAGANWPHWVASKDNPLTARVIVNRVWQWHFGAGLVRTPNNFGLLSEPPSHPELLDWLAARFVEDGWSLKKLHRRIVLSATYQHNAARLHAEQLDTRSREPLARPLHPAPAGGRSDPRRDAVRRRASSTRRPAARPGDDLDHAAPFALRADGPLGPQQLRDAVRRRQSRRVGGEARTSAPSPRRRCSCSTTTSCWRRRKHLAERLIRDVPEATNAARIQRRLPTAVRPARQLRKKSAIARADLLGQTRPSRTPAWADLAHVLLCSNEFVYLD